MKPALMLNVGAAGPRSRNGASARAPVDYGESGPPLRILQLVARPQRRGAEVFAYQLSRTLRKEGNDVKIAYLYDCEGDADLPVDAHDTLIGESECHPSERGLGANPRLLWKLGRLLRSYRPDVVQLNGDRTVKYGCMLRWLVPGAPWSVVYRNIGNPLDWTLTGLRQLAFRRLIAGVDGAVAISNSSLEAIRRLYPGLLNGTVIHNGIDPLEIRADRSRAAIRAELATLAGNPVVVSVGSLSHEKRPDLLLSAFALVRKDVPDAVLWMVGVGPLLGELERQAQQLSIAAAVRFTGVRADVGSVMSAADVFALTSDTEGMPAVVLEAGYHGVPAVVTRVGGIPECVLDGETGSIVDRRDVGMIGGALTAFLTSVELRTRVGRQARVHITEHFTMDRIADQYVRFYRSLVPASRVQA